MKGEEREKNLARDEYFNNGYFSLRTLVSFTHQLNHIKKINPKTMLEIGKGNGFVSTYLKLSGVKVTTVDINPNLSPDIVASILDLPDILKKEKYDLVVCCEVLEHLEFAQFENCLFILRQYSSNLYLTLPQYRKWFGFSGFMRIPKIDKIFRLGFYLRTKKNLDNGHIHFWEIDYEEKCSRSKILENLKKYYQRITNGCYELNPYHEFFICKGE
jgi:hypothetical protein